MRITFKILSTICISFLINWSCSQASGQESSLTIILTGSMHGQLDPCG